MGFKGASYTSTGSNIEGYTFVAPVTDETDPQYINYENAIIRCLLIPDSDASNITLAPDNGVEVLVNTATQQQVNFEITEANKVALLGSSSDIKVDFRITIQPVSGSQITGEDGSEYVDSFRLRI